MGADYWYNAELFFFFNICMLSNHRIALVKKQL